MLAAELTDVQQQQLQWADRIQRAEAGQATAQQVLAAAQQEHAQAEAMMAEQVSAKAVTGWPTTGPQCDIQGAGCRSGMLTGSPSAPFSEGA